MDFQILLFSKSLHPDPSRRFAPQGEYTLTTRSAHPELVEGWHAYKNGLQAVLLACVGAHMHKRPVLRQTQDEGDLLRIDFSHKTGEFYI